MGSATGVADAEATEDGWSTGATGLALVGLLCAGAFALYALAVIDLAPLLLWLAVVGFLLAAFAVAGFAMCGRYVGFLITDNNVMSASRTQAALWFVAIVSTYVVLWALNLRKSPTDAVALTQGALLASVAASGSLVGAQLLNAPKAARKLTDAKRAEVEKLVTDIDSQAKAQGVLWRNTDPGQAKLADIFEGDEVVEAGAVDAGKLQMLVLTLVLVLLYLVQFFARLGDADPPNAVPDIDTTVASLLGLSHAGYLGNKLPLRTNVP